MRFGLKRKYKCRCAQYGANCGAPAKLWPNDLRLCEYCYNGHKHIKQATTE